MSSKEHAIPIKNHRWLRDPQGNAYIYGYSGHDRRRKKPKVIVTSPVISQKNSIIRTKSGTYYNLSDEQSAPIFTGST